MVDFLNQGKMIRIIFAIPARFRFRVFDISLEESWQPFWIRILFNGLKFRLLIVPEKCPCTIVNRSKVRLMDSVGVNYDPPVVMVTVIVPHDSIESEHPSVLPQNRTCLIRKLRLYRLLNKLKSKQVLGCSSLLYFLYKSLIL